MFKIFLKPKLLVGFLLNPETSFPCWGCWLWLRECGDVDKPRKVWIVNIFVVESQSNKYFKAEQYNKIINIMNYVCQQTALGRGITCYCSNPQHIYVLSYEWIWMLIDMISCLRRFVIISNVNVMESLPDPFPVVWVIKYSEYWDYNTRLQH